MCCSIDSMACCFDQQLSSSLTKHRTKSRCSFESHPPTPSQGIFSSAMGFIYFILLFYLIFAFALFSAFLFQGQPSGSCLDGRGASAQCYLPTGGWNYVPCYVTDLENVILWVGRACAPPQPTPQCLGLTQGMMHFNSMIAINDQRHSEKRSLLKLCV